MKRVLCILVWLLISTTSYAQTWQVPHGTHNDGVYEYTVITRQQFERLLRQYEAQYTHAIIQYTDVLEMGEEEIISGQKPVLNGYYFLLCRIIPLTHEFNIELTRIGMGISLDYGNSETGVMTIWFLNQLGGVVMFAHGAVRIGSDEYYERMNQLISFVNDE